MTATEKPDRMNPDYQQAVADMVRHEVHYCVSSLVATLAESFGATVFDAANERATNLGHLCEQAANLAAPILDYESAAYDAGWRRGGDNGGFIYDGLRFESWKEAAASEDSPTYTTWQECCEDRDIDPYDHDVYEHWIISDWLADKLEARGEKVDRDFAGLTVWARTTTGQRISMDMVICSIYDELHA